MNVRESVCVFGSFFLCIYDGINFWQLHTIAHFPIWIESKFIGLRCAIISVQCTHKIGKLDFNEIIRIEKRN